MNGISKLRASFCLSNLLFTLMIGQSVAARGKTIREICGDHHATARRAQTVDELRESVCRFASTTTSDQTLLLSNQLLNAITSAQSQAGGLQNWKSNKELVSLMGALSESSEKVPVESAEASRGLRRALLDLNAKWSDPKLRKQNLQAYAKDLEAVVALTKSGPKVLDCFLKPKDGVFGDSVVQEETEAVNNLPVPGQGAMMRTMYAKNAAGQMQKIIRVDPLANPTLALHAFAHELLHTCSIGEKMKLSADTSPEGKVRSDQFRMVDEVRAFQFQSKFFKEIAQAAPKLVCSGSLVSAAFNTIPMREYDWIASNGEKIENGSFPIHMLANYLNVSVKNSSGQTVKVYDARNSYFQSADGGGDPAKLRADFKDLLIKSGFKVED